MSMENNPQDKSLNQQNISKQDLGTYTTDSEGLGDQATTDGIISGWVRNSSKEETINRLQNTINQLNDVINQINNDSLTNLPSENILNNLLEDSNKLLTSLNSPTIQEIKSTVNKDEWDEIIGETPKPPVKSILQDRKKATPKKSILTNIKSLITKPIILIILVILAIALFFIPNFLKPNSTQEIVKNLPVDSTEIIEKTPSINIEKEPKIIENLSENLPNNVEEKTEKSLGNKVEEKEIVEIPLELVEPEKPSLVEIIPPPETELTPEQNLIASIQNQVAETTKKYADGLILGIKANFITGYLTITIDDKWYEITENEQNKLTEEILEKAQILDFYKLKIIDIKGNLIARNPVVGNQMIIVRR